MKTIKLLEKFIIFITFASANYSCQKDTAPSPDIRPVPNAKDTITLITDVIGGFGQTNSFFSYDTITTLLSTKLTGLGQQKDSCYFFYNAKRELTYFINTRSWCCNYGPTTYRSTIFERDVQGRVINVYLKAATNSSNENYFTRFSDPKELTLKDSLLYDNKGRVSKIYELAYGGGVSQISSISNLSYNFSNDSLLSRVTRIFQNTGDVYDMQFNSYDNKLNPLYRDFKNSALCPGQFGYGERLSVLPFRETILSKFFAFSPSNCTDISYSTSNGTGTNYGGYIKYLYNKDSLPTSHWQKDEMTSTLYRYGKFKK